MVNFNSAARFIMPKVVNHQPGSMSHDTFGARSAGIKVVGEGSGLPADTQEECETALARCFDYAEKLKMGFSGVFFAFLHEENEAQPTDLANQRKAFAYAQKHGYDCWLSKRGKLTVGHNQTGMKRRKAQPTRALPKAEATALAAFLKD